MENLNQVCRICLDSIYNQTCTSIDNFISEKLEIVIPGMHAQLSCKSVICNGCSQLVNDICSFKYNCFKAEEIILEKISKIKSDRKLYLSDIILWTDNTPKPLRSNQENICRTCLRLHEKRNQASNVNEQHLVKKHVPELDLNLTLTPDVCEICSKILYRWDDFKRVYLNTENVIKSYCSTFRIQYEDMDIYKVFEFTKVWNWQQLNDYFATETTESLSKSDKFEVKSESPGTNVETCEENEKEKYNTRCEEDGPFKLIVQETVETVLKPIKRNGVHMFICPKCKKIVKDIAEHLYEHSDNECKLTYQCYKCDYRNKFKNNLKVHLLSHEGGSQEILYSCPQCSFQARQKGNLLTHLLVHKRPEEIKMYKCPVCKFQARQKGNLKTHSLTHKKPEEIEMFKCNICSYQARQKGNLQTHYLRKHKHFDDKLLEEALLYKCNKCSYKAKQKPSLKKHMLSHGNS